MYLLGTDEYIDRVVRNYSPLLLRVAFTRLKSTADAEDVVQDVFIRLLTKKPFLRDEDHEKAWLIRVTINLSNDFLKSGARLIVPLDDNSVTAPNDESTQLLSAVTTLPEKYCTVIHLYYYEGYSIKEIARILKLPAATVGTRLSRAREQLKTILQGEEPIKWIKVNTEPLSTR